MAMRLRDRRPRMGLGGNFITVSGTAMKWTGLALTCLSSLGVAVFQRGLLKMDAYATLEDLAQALADPGSGAMGQASGAVLCSLLSAIAIPLYAKLVYERWKHGGDKRQFFLRLGLCALAAEIPYDFAMNGKLLDLSVQNPAWGLLLCAAMLEVLSLPKSRGKTGAALLRALIVAGALAWAVLLRVYVGVTLVLLAALFYFLEGHRGLSALCGVLLTAPQFPAPFGMLPVHWYEPDEKEDGRYPALFYILYPAQLLVFGAAGMLLRHTFS